MRNTNSNILELRSLVSKIDNELVRKTIEKWVEENIVEFGWYAEITKQALMCIEDDKDKYVELQKKQCAFELAKLVLDSCGLTETFETLDGERTEYRVFGVKK